jgi:pSer/pThr/pTyr-binding forkhead associated (FHA) protein
VFRRDSIFESMQEHGEPTAEFAVATEPVPPTWLREVRAELPANGRYLACRDDDAIRIFPVKSGWTRVGRSVAADIRLDDPSVSRRHALLVSEPDESLRILDDRSLNGVFVNGELVEWGTIEDGGELRIGRYRLFAIES